MIARHYVRSWWFVIDVVSIASAIPDIVGDESVEEAFLLRLVRVIRLVKLVRVLRGSRLFKRWEIRFSIDYQMLELFNTMIAICLLCHWFACVWGLQAAFDPLNSWPGDMGFCESWGDGPEGDAPTCPGDRVCKLGPCSDSVCSGGVSCRVPVAMYMECMYVAVATCTSGGAYKAAFGNTGEKLIATIMVLLSGVVWSQLIGVLCGVATNLNPLKQAFRKGTH